MSGGLAFKCRKLLGILGAPIASRVLLRHGVAAAMEHVPAIRESGDLRTLVDIGANRGQFALAMRTQHATTKIYSFEPLAEAASVLRRVFCSDALVQVFEVAIGPRSEYASMHVSGRDDSSSLLAIAPEQDVLFPGTAEVGRKQVRVCRLSDCIEAQDVARPAMLKLDVQGYELEALRGSVELLHCFDVVLVECSFVELYVDQALAGQVIEWMCNKRFLLSGVFNLTYDVDGRPVQADFLFRRMGEVGDYLTSESDE